MLNRFLKKKSINYMRSNLLFTLVKFYREIFASDNSSSRLLTTRVTHSRLVVRGQRNREERAGYRERDKRS